jgi:hypothetical protein
MHGTSLQNIRSYSRRLASATIGARGALRSYQLRFAESGGSISIFGILYRNSRVATFYTYKVSGSDRDPSRALLPVIYVSL